MNSKMSSIDRANPPPKSWSDIDDQDEDDWIGDHEAWAQSFRSTLPSASSPVVSEQAKTTTAGAPSYDDDVPDTEEQQDEIDGGFEASGCPREVVNEDGSSPAVNGHFTENVSNDNPSAAVGAVYVEQHFNEGSGNSSQPQDYQPGTPCFEDGTPHADHPLYGDYHSQDFSKWLDMHDDISDKALTIANLRSKNDILSKQVDMHGRGLSNEEVHRRTLDKYKWAKYGENELNQRRETDFITIRNGHKMFEAMKQEIEDLKCGMGLDKLKRAKDEEIEDLRKKLEAANKENESLKKVHEQDVTDINELRGTNLELRGKIDAHEVTIARLDHSFKAAKEENESLVSKHHQAGTELSNLRSDKLELQRKVDSQENLIETLEDSKSDLQLEVASLNRYVNKLFDLVLEESLPLRDSNPPVDQHEIVLLKTTSDLLDAKNRIVNLEMEVSNMEKTHRRAITSTSRYHQIATAQLDDLVAKQKDKLSALETDRSNLNRQISELKSDQKKWEKLLTHSLKLTFPAIQQKGFAGNNHPLTLLVNLAIEHLCDQQDALTMAYDQNKSLTESITVLMSEFDKKSREVSELVYAAVPREEKIEQLELTVASKAKDRALLEKTIQDLFKNVNDLRIDLHKGHEEITALKKRSPVIMSSEVTLWSGSNVSGTSIESEPTFEIQHNQAKLSTDSSASFSNLEIVSGLPCWNEGVAYIHESFIHSSTSINQNAAVESPAVVEPSSSVESSSPVDSRDGVVAKPTTTQAGTHSSNAIHKYSDSGVSFNLVDDKKLILSTQQLTPATVRQPIITCGDYSLSSPPVVVQPSQPPTPTINAQQDVYSIFDLPASKPRRFRPKKLARKLGNPIGKVSRKIGKLLIDSLATPFESYPEGPSVSFGM